MEQLNEYIFNVFDLILKSHQGGIICKPKEYKINKDDRIILKKIYDLHRIYRYGITRSKFNEMVVNYTLSTLTNTIKGGQEVAELLEKTIIK